MSSGLITLTGAGGTSTTVTITRPGGHTMTDAINVTSAGAPAVTLATGEHVMGATTGAIPLYWSDFAAGAGGAKGRTNAGPYGTGTWALDTDAHLRGAISNALTVDSDSSKLGTYPVNGGDNTFASRALWDDGQNVDLVDLYTATGTGTVAFTGNVARHRIKAYNTAGEAAAPRLRHNFTVTNRPYQHWAGRIVAHDNTFTPFGDADNTNWGALWNTASTITSAFTVTPAITATGVQTVATSTQHLSGAFNKAVIILDSGGANQETLTYDGNASPAAGKWTQSSTTAVIINPTKTHPAGAVCDVSTDTAKGGLGGQGDAYKWGMFSSLVGHRCGLYVANGNQAGNYGEYILENSHVSADGVIQSTGDAQTGTELSSGLLYGEVVFFQQFISTADSQNYLGIVFFLTGSGYATEQACRNAIYNGTASWVQKGSWMVGLSSSSTAREQYNEVQGTGENYNQSRATDLHRYLSCDCCFDADTYSDPFGIVAYINALVPETPAAASLSGSATTSLATFNVTLARFAGKLRAKVDGSWISGQDYTIPDNVGELTGATSSNQHQPVVVHPTLTGLTSGTHTVLWYAVSRNGANVSTSGASTGTITVT